MINQQVARLFNEMADLLELKGENPFRVRAYRRAAQTIDGLPEDIALMPEERLLELPGIGKDLAAKIKEYAASEKIAAHDKLAKDLPPGVLNMLSIPGLGPKTAKLLFDKLNIKDIEELEAFAKEHRLSVLPGIKEKTEENILKGIAMLKRGRERQPLGKVLPLARELLEQLQNKAPATKLCLAGSLRRWKESIKDIDILATSRDAKKVMKVFVKLPHVQDILMHGPTKSSVTLSGGLQVDLRVVEEGSFGAALAYFTGSREHNIKLRELARQAGLKINEYGIFRASDDKKLGGEKEEDLYRLLGMQYIPPELREDTGEIEAAKEGRLPSLVALADIKGDLHVHSRWSDGSHTFEELIDAARKRGYEYIAITDHTKGLGIARGLNEEKLTEELKEVKALNKRLKGFRLLTGVEVDIKSDCMLDMPDEMLKRLDIVVASIHSGFKQGKEQLTKRLTSALRNPYVSVIAHPTGRLIGEREAYDVDMEKLLTTAKETGKAMELNAYPLRLDLKDIHVKRAKEMGVPVVISTDAHLTEQFDYMEYGVSTGRRGWLEKGDVRNTLGAENLLKWLKSLCGDNR